MNSWNLSDNSRNESRSPANQIVNVVLLSGKYAGSIIYFERNNVLTIKKAMIESNGAPGLQAPMKGYAGIIKINIQSQTSGEGSGGFQLTIPEYNKWYDLKTMVKPFETLPEPDFTGAPAGVHPLIFQIASQGSFAYDGYNISSDYVGQEFAPRVILELDTAGVYNNSYAVI